MYFAFLVIFLVLSSTQGKNVTKNEKRFEEKNRQHSNLKIISKEAHEKQVQILANKHNDVLSLIKLPIFEAIYSEYPPSFQFSVYNSDSKSTIQNTTAINATNSVIYWTISGPLRLISINELKEMDQGKILFSVHQNKGDLVKFTAAELVQFHNVAVQSMQLETIASSNTPVEENVMSTTTIIFLIIIISLVTGLLVIIACILLISYCVKPVQTLPSVAGSTLDDLLSGNKNGNVG